MPHDSFRRTSHRPWPTPRGPWFMRQTWSDLLFAHWPVPASVLQPLVPEELEIQEYDGTSWVGVVPFRMEGVAPRFVPDIPGFSAFPELNLRLYVTHGDKPGVWFLSLDATNPVAVWAARRFFYLPYFRAEISISSQQDGFDYSCARTDSSSDVRFAALFHPLGDPYEASPGTLEHWLTERYCLYAKSPAGRLTRTEVHHHPWTLQAANAEIKENRLADCHGFTLDGPPMLTHFSRRIDVVAWKPQSLT